MYDEDRDYQPEFYQNQTTDLLLDQLELELMRTNIEDQINGNSESKVDFLSIVLSKFNEIIDSIDDTDAKYDLKTEIIDFCNTLLMLLSDKYDLMLDVVEYDTLEVTEILTNIYHFFIIDKDDIVQRFFINYIDNNKDGIVSSLALTAKGKDITSIAMRKRNFDKNNIAILSNITDVIQFIIDADVEPLEFISTIYDGDYYVTKIEEYIQCYKINGNFVPILIGDMNDDYSSTKTTSLRNNIRTALFN